MKKRIGLRFQLRPNKMDNLFSNLFRFLKQIRVKGAVGMI